MSSARSSVLSRRRAAAPLSRVPSGRVISMSEASTVAQKVSKVLIVDDHPAIREALAIRISKIPDMEVCGETEDMADALRLILERKPDIAVVDISLKTGD